MISTLFYAAKAVAAILAVLIASGLAVAIVLVLVKWTLFLVRFAWDAFVEEIDSNKRWVSRKFPKKDNKE